ncbi:concanavalin A-like lectin/glucanase domain-containing protein [Exophiala viscosa]|uniref:Concanavalin A-like lectin/glucanase domain-containing protein n=1 Tax=Exophiala viscosa TaxID=2486360 RepID=A0AAN6E7K2_9EURO|nr:concanavalin A-like lectin/glucanase domain-containing protein [Exophiala viscosa]KAI1627796.1 concanavalin A-like lectin/glucanase domain-containing protein [Exophiala viscosa]
MPFSGRAGGLSTKTVVEEDDTERSFDGPSPGTRPVRTLSTTDLRTTGQEPQYVGYRRSGDNPGDRAGYFPWKDNAAQAGSTPTSRRPSGADIPRRDMPRRTSTSQGLWTRSKSVAENYFKPAMTEQPWAAPTSETRRGSVAGPGESRRGSVAGPGGSRRGSQVAGPGSATDPSDETHLWMNDAVFARRRSTPVFPVPDYSMSNATSGAQAGNRGGSMSSTQRRLAGSQDLGSKTQPSKYRSGWDRRLSLSDYIKPKAETEGGFGRRTTRGTSTSGRSTSPSVSAKSGQIGDVPSTGFQSKIQSLWASPVSKTSESPTYPPFTPRSGSENLFDNITYKARQSVVKVERAAPRRGVYFRSRRIREKDLDLSWLKQNKDPRLKWLSLIPIIGLLLGLCIAGAYIFLGIQTVPIHKYCMVYQDDFSSSSTLNSDIWTKEVEVGGYGNGQFEETTGTDENVFIKDGMLQIMPTLQDASLLVNNATLNLTKLGTCTSDVWSNCVATTNTTNGTIVSPVRSGRINTKKGANLKYGRIEVVAKLPQGDWLWPAIWMLPTDSVYGSWPQSGEIDIAESRGNNHSYYNGGNNVMSSTLHWGPDSTDDAWWRTYGKVSALHSAFPDQFHTFGLEWSEKYLYTYLDSRLLQVLYNRFDIPFWQRGNFALSYSNGTSTVDPWSETGNDATPFDQEFYLILNVAVGGTNGWFTDGEDGKPWVDASPTAKRDFWTAKNSWYPTWQNKNGNALQVKSVKMWQQQGYNGCGAEAVDIR